MTPLVFLHGFLGSPDVWDPVIAELGHAAPIEKVWLPGHGPKASDVPSQMPQFSEPAWLIGYSLGARTALAMAVAKLERVAGLILIGANPGLRSEAEREQRAQADDALARRLVEGGIEAFVNEWESLPLFASQKNLSASVRDAHRRRRTNHIPERVAEALQSSSLGRMPSLWDALKENTIPIHVVTGSLDEKFTAIAKEMAATIPFTHHTVVEGAGHDVVLERPAALAAVIRAALKETA